MNCKLRHLLRKLVKVGRRSERHVHLRFYCSSERPWRVFDDQTGCVTTGRTAREAARLMRDWYRSGRPVRDPSP